MARVFSPRNVLLLVTIYVIQSIKCEEHCETRDLRALVKHVRQLETEFKSFTDSTFVKLNELKSTMKKELDELREMINQTTTTAMTTPSSSVPSLSSAPSVTSTPTPVSTTTESTCPEGWERNGSSCYYIEMINLYFDDAQEFCKNRSANLVHVNDATENDFLKSLMEKKWSEWFWIGLKYRAADTTWRWIDNNTLADFTYWYPGEPSDGGAAECCVTHRGLSFRWADAYSKTWTATPFCEKGLR